jgi:hypothetical protein
MSDAPEKAKEIWAVVGYIGPQNMRGEWATDPAKIMGGVTSYTRTDLYTAALTRMTDLEAAARHNSDWARQAIADKEEAEKERDALKHALHFGLFFANGEASAEVFTRLARQALKGNPNAD